MTTSAAVKAHATRRTKRAAGRAWDTRRAHPERKAQDAADREELVMLAKLIARKAKNRDITPRRTPFIREDKGIRIALDALVRAWDEKDRYISVGAKRARRGAHGDHVVRVRVLVDRMIMNPDECEELFKKAIVIARVTPTEHLKLGGAMRHPELYGRMLTANVARLYRRGLERYDAEEITLLEV